jgi:hypothetical protein
MDQGDAGCLCALHRQMDDGHSLNLTALPIMGTGLFFLFCVFCSDLDLFWVLLVFFCIILWPKCISASDRSWM